tara:strand:- start:374 stop:550 length:177 start_codon:yes stop_codon:yes gene_type:complete
MKQKEVWQIYLGSVPISQTMKSMHSFVQTSDPLLTNQSFTISFSDLALTAIGVPKANV